MRFLYLRDPLFLCCVLVYFANRLILKTVWTTGFVHEHLNDLICIPFWVPIMLWVERCLRLRQDDRSPEAIEVIIPLLIWSWVFEIILPRTDMFRRYCTADPWDIVYYSIGAIGASIVWRWWYRD
ncbi:MAG: hypothetical protein QM703_26290 [Gemmatales bacterium]